MANFANSNAISKEMKGFVRHICLLLLMVCAVLATTNRQEEMALPEATPCNLSYTASLQAQHQPVRKTITHLCAENIATPATAAIQQWSHSSFLAKFKCLTPEAKAEEKARQTFDYKRENNPYTQLLHLHAIDYYIYTLEHIII